MADMSPTKRRKTRGGFAIKARKVSWPANQLPVEIFTLIISFLPRSSIQNMRLVNREFEEKVSEYLFRVVVVPFKPEIYGITPEPPLAATSNFCDRSAIHGSVMLQDKGMRVFQGFGRWILKFAMSFEFDEGKLANPPSKSDQEAITSFWGIYRWPFKKYNRYAQLEGLEQTADETKTMAKALRFVNCAKELGLSIDGGLGWLAGPDVNQKIVDEGNKNAVFGETRFVPESRPKPIKAEKISRSLNSSSSSRSSDILYTAMERMLHEAGYRGDSLEASVRMMFETEKLTEVSQNHTPNIFPSPLSLEGIRLATSHISTGNVSMTADAGYSSSLMPNGLDNEDETETNQISLASATSNMSKSRIEAFSLKPNNLTNAQREMLLEIEWAQRAFMQSYAIAIIDNAMTFQNIEALTIARLPNRHLSVIRRDDFWDGLPQLEKLSLAIIPDWREVAKLPTSWVEDIWLPPSHSVSGVYQILQEQISMRKHIKNIHFEWICGGEYAPGLFSRNQHILAAPVIPNAMDMVNRAISPPVLSLPHVRRLSLKNCWISPHIMEKFGLILKAGALQSLILDSVSLTAPLGPNLVAGAVMNPHIIQQVANNAAANNVLVNFQGLPGGHHIHALPSIPTDNNSQPRGPDWLQTPRIGSWAHLIEILTPGLTLSKIRHERDIGPEPPARKPTRLTKLEFKSCGYVRLPLGFDQSVLDPPEVADPQANSFSKRIADIEPFMMKSHDLSLGVIVNHIDAIELNTLENAWHMTVGWKTSRPTLIAEAQADGISHAGQGRFDGIIEVAKTQ